MPLQKTYEIYFSKLASCNNSIILYPLPIWYASFVTMKFIFGCNKISLSEEITEYSWISFPLNISILNKSFVFVEKFFAIIKSGVVEENEDQWTDLPL